MTALIDTNISFIENKDFDYEHVNKNFLQKEEQERLRLYEQYNCLNRNGIYEISLFVGLNSTFNNNQILNSSIYEEDDTLGKDLTPFNDIETYKGNRLSVQINPKKLVKTYGIENSSEAFNDFMDMPYEDLDGTSSVSEYFTDPETVNFIRYFSDYALEKLNGGISIFGSVESITGRRLTLYNLKGIKGDIITGSTDARNRQINISNRVIFDGNNTPDKIEPFLDQLNDTNITNNASQINVGYSYKVENINNKNYLVFNNNSTSSSAIIVDTTSQYYLSDEKSNILPFDDRKTKEFTNEIDLKLQDIDYNSSNNYTSSGISNNNANGGLPESFAFIGEIN